MLGKKRRQWMYSKTMSNIIRKYAILINANNHNIVTRVLSYNVITIIRVRCKLEGRGGKGGWRYFFTKTGVFNAKVVLVEGHLAGGGRAAAVRAGGTGEGLLVSHVLRS